MPWQMNSQLTIHSFECGGQTLRIDPPLVVTIYPDPEDPTLAGLTMSGIIDHKGDLWIDIDTSLTEQRAGIDTELRVLWEEYAMADDSELTAGAIELKHKLLARIKPEED